MGIEVYFILFFLALALSLFWSLVFRSVKSATKRKVITILLTIASIPILYLGLVMLFIVNMNYYPNRDLDKEKWRSDPEMRYELTKDLINSEILIGKTRAQVKAILGEETGNEDNEDLWYYDIGLVSSTHNIDPDILEIQFKNDKVVLVIQRHT